MCRQFDVYRNPSERTRHIHPYIMVIQHDYHGDLSTRLVLPLSRHAYLNGYYHRATPLVNIDFQTVASNTPLMTSINKDKRKNRHFICNLRSERSSAISAIDALITNT
ncbi:CcdB family protein [Kluyvera sichuanensis]|uniref:CcdB family protein n=1 Tax=Kluyvera sichuanensis TaxID=2725494 RepID=UPI0039F4A0E7